MRKMKINLDKTIKISIIFLIGFLSANIAGLYLVYGSEMPLSLNINKGFLGFSSKYDNSVPFDFINENQILVYDDKIIINVDGASIGRYAPTGSMKPLLDEGGIFVVEL